LALSSKNVVIQLFVQTLEDESLLWFNALLTNSIINWNELTTQFNEKYSVLVDNHSLLKYLTTISKRADQTFKDFNLRFTWTKTKVPTILRPSDDIFFLFYIQDLDLEIRYILKNKGVNDLANVMDTTKRIKNNIFESSKKERPTSIPVRIEKKESLLISKSPKNLRLLQTLNNEITSLKRQVGKNKRPFFLPNRN